MNPYRSAEWRAFREQVLFLDKYQCVTCGACRSSGAILHVHHKSYEGGKLPWEYPFSACETLCAGCHAAEHGLIPPKVGWVFVGHDDLGSISGVCDLCGTDIRHVFLIEHPDWFAMEVGEICCDHLTDTDIASNFMESVRRFNDRRKRFVESPRWKLHTVGHEFIIQRQLAVEIRTLGENCQLRINGKIGQLRYPTTLKARAKAFDVLEAAEHQDFRTAQLKTRISVSAALLAP
jgi:hypothetical protein